MRRKKSIKNLAFGMIQIFITSISNFIMTPLIVENFGSVINGLILTIKQIIGYTNLVGAGIAQASIFQMYKPIADDDHENINLIYNQTNSMFNKVGKIFSLITLLIAFIYPFTLSGVNYSVVFLLVVVMSISGASEFFVCGKYTVILTASQNNYVLSIAQCFGYFSNLIFLFVGIKCGFNIIILELLLSLFYILRIIIMKTYTYKLFPYLHINKKYKSTNDKTSYQRNDVVIHQICGLIVTGSSSIISSIVCGLEETSVLATYFIIVNVLNLVCSTICNSVGASFGDVIAKGDKHTLKKSYDIFEIIYLMILGIIYTVTFLMFVSFVTLYTKNMTDINYIRGELIAIVILNSLIFNIRMPGYTLMNSAGHFKQTKKYAINEVIINLSMQIILGNILGINGIVIGCIISSLYRANNFIVYTNKTLLKQSCKKAIFRICYIFIVSCCIISIVNYSGFINVISYSSWVITSTIVTLITSMIYLVLFGFYYVFFKRKL